jgi:hypothetical protein
MYWSTPQNTVGHGDNVAWAGHQLAHAFGQQIGLRYEPMEIEKSKILNAEKYLSALPPNSTFKIVSHADDSCLERAGFQLPAEVGSATLPAVVGRVSRFNAEGRWLSRRDLPKEERYIGSREFQRVEWHGRDRVEVSDTVDYHRMCYVRELIPPPSVELTIANVEGTTSACSPALTYSPAQEEHNKHVVNLMLELFGKCEIVSTDLARFTPPSTKRVNWIMLPPGEHPWPRVEEHIRRFFGGKSPSVATAVLNRQEAILSFEPSAVFRGLGGFSDYIAYEFKDRGLVVLESVFYGNALYATGHDWTKISQKTKAEIIQQNLAEHRIVHTKGWVAQLASALRPAKAAE